MIFILGAEGIRIIELTLTSFPLGKINILKERGILFILRKNEIQYLLKLSYFLTIPTFFTRKINFLNLKTLINIMISQGFNLLINIISISCSIIKKVFC